MLYFLLILAVKWSTDRHITKYKVALVNLSSTTGLRVLLSCARCRLVCTGLKNKALYGQERISCNYVLILLGKVT